jgi:hypothetical protein
VKICNATGAQEFMREHEKAMEHNDKVLEQQEGGGEGEGAKVCPHLICFLLICSS